MRTLLVNECYLDHTWVDTVSTSVTITCISQLIESSIGLISWAI